MATDTRRALFALVPMFLSVGVLLTLGISSVMARAAAAVPGVSGDEGQKQLVFVAFSAAAFLAVQLVNYRTLLRISPALYVVTLLPICYTILGRFASLPFVRPVKGASAWLIFGPISFQPAELTKIALIVILSWMFRDTQEACASPRPMLKGMFISGIAMALILAQPDLGTVLTLIAPVLTVLLLGGVRVRHLLSVAAIGIAIAPALWFSGEPDVPVLNQLPRFVKDYQRQRVQAMFSDDPRMKLDTGYQQDRALEAMGSAGPKGKGARNIPIGEHVPESHTDMIFALIAEQYGILGSGIVLASYLVIFASGLTVANLQRDPAGKLLVAGLVALIAGQAFLNLAVCLRVMPVTGVTLPLVSYGGSSLMASMVALGLMTNVARNQKKLLL